MTVTATFPNQAVKNQGNRRALVVSRMRQRGTQFVSTMIGKRRRCGPHDLDLISLLLFYRFVVVAHRCIYPSFFFTKDVSNRRTDDNADNKGLNVKKRNGASVALPTQRSVTLESESRDVEVSVNANRVNDFSAVFPPMNMNVAPLPQAAEMRNFLIGVNDDVLSYQYSGPADDIDERDSEDPLCATAYVQDMYEHFRLKEMSTSVRPVYMEDQQYINERMRSILVDWLVEVHLKFKLVPETLYLTVNIIDRYLSKTEVSRPKLQLVGVTALLIASKYEEIYPPELRDLVYICDRAYSKVEVRSTLLLCDRFICVHYKTRHSPLSLFPSKDP